MKEHKRKYYKKLLEKFIKIKKEIKKDGKILNNQEQTEYDGLTAMQETITEMMKD